MFGIRFGGKHQVIHSASEQQLWVCNITNGKNSSFCFAVTCRFRKALDFENFLLSYYIYGSICSIPASLRQETVIKNKVYLLLN